jgi:hypothetical protein
VNSDDAFLPGALRAVGRYFARTPDTTLLVGGCLFIDPEGDAIRTRRGWPRYYPPDKQTFDKVFYVGHGFCQPATFFSRAAFFQAGGFDRSMFFAFDYDLLLRLTQQKPGRTINVPLACFRVHEGSKTVVHDDIARRDAEALHDKYRSAAATGWRCALRMSWYRHCWRWRVRWALLKHRLRISRLPLSLHAGRG